MPDNAYYWNKALLEGHLLVDAFRDVIDAVRDETHARCVWKLDKSTDTSTRLFDAQEASEEAQGRFWKQLYEFEDQHTAEREG